MNLTIKYRPKTIDEIIGQRHLFAKDAALYQLIEKKRIPHALFFGSPGSGKTTTAKIIASEMGSDFYELDASNLKIEEVRKILSRHRGTLSKPIIFIDEVHRLSKNQQEALLIPMERDECVIIGASTENPFYVLTSAFRSRSMLFEFKPLENGDLSLLLDRIQNDLAFTISKEAREFLIHTSNKDARSMLNLLDFALSITHSIERDTLKSLRTLPVGEGASSDDTHYHLISAMIKSIRGSDIDAGLYYLARLINAGESADFIARRLVILSSEDIGNANPGALNLATSTMLAVSKIGYPEARIILSQCVIYLASSPKSNSAYRAINRALEAVKTDQPPVPEHLRDFHHGYRYPHDFGGWVEQEYLCSPADFYSSDRIGFEKNLNEWLSKIKNNRNETLSE
jgi:putative ATPase